eukprot:CAMPEP_0170579630 /NCGR_PEP_ID=MMETSP0224-20130122/6082_1 /TAXON_ID=285029 /ORGANISM="Togula jolla, Strain CCCM 725" /LENGTH=93 /DNA_ID=CAMNT_0010902659 /DNA_START=367 /DNA_END=648 /DNA_ORIENTATION=-
MPKRRLNRRRKLCSDITPLEAETGESGGTPREAEWVGCQRCQGEVWTSSLARRRSVGAGTAPAQGSFKARGSTAIFEAGSKRLRLCLALLADL